MLIFFPMPRRNALSLEDRKICQRLKLLRKALRMPRTEFADLIGLAGTRLENREAEISPWQPSELSQAKRKVAEHLQAGAKVLATVNV